MESMSQQDRPSWLPTELYPFESRYLQVEGACVHYVDEGSGPTLLLLHGNPAWSFLSRGPERAGQGLAGEYAAAR